jgi:hypothetical protein
MSAEADNLRAEVKNIRAHYDEWRHAATLSADRLENEVARLKRVHAEDEQSLVKAHAEEIRARTEKHAAHVEALTEVVRAERDATAKPTKKRRPIADEIKAIALQHGASECTVYHGPKDGELTLVVCMQSGRYLQEVVDALLAAGLHPADYTIREVKAPMVVRGLGEMHAGDKP